MKKFFSAVILAAAVFASGFVLTACSNSETSRPAEETAPKSETAETAETVTAEKSAPETESAENSAPEKSATQKKSEVSAETLFAGVEEKISATLSDGAEYSVFLAYPQKSSTPFIYNAKKMRSASMIKVFILAATLDKVKAGSLSLDESLMLQSSDKVGGAGILAGYPTGSQLTLREVLRLMIIHSDNTATNMIIDRVGMNAINSYIQANDYRDTVLQRKMMDFNGKENYSSVTDLGNIFVKIYNHSCVSEQLDDVMIEFLKDQTDTDCFPVALPEKVIAHKTGALAGLYDDGGIIYSGRSVSENDAVLVIMDENIYSEQSAINHMISFTRAVIQ